MPDLTHVSLLKLRHGFHVSSMNEFHTFVCKGSRKHRSCRCRQQGKIVINCSDQTILHPTPHHTALHPSSRNTLEQRREPHSRTKHSTAQRTPQHPRTIATRIAVPFLDADTSPCPSAPRTARARPRRSLLSAHRAPPHRGAAPSHRRLLEGALGVGAAAAVGDGGDLSSQQGALVLLRPPPRDVVHAWHHVAARGEGDDGDARGRGHHGEVGEQLLDEAQLAEEVGRTHARRLVHQEHQLQPSAARPQAPHLALEGAPQLLHFALRRVGQRRRLQGRRRKSWGAEEGARLAARPALRRRRRQGQRQSPPAAESHQGPHGVAAGARRRRRAREKSCWSPPDAPPLVYSERLRPASLSPCRPPRRPSQVSAPFNPPRLRRGPSHAPLSVFPSSPFGSVLPPRPSPPPAAPSRPDGSQPDSGAGGGLWKRAEQE